MIKVTIETNNMQEFDSLFDSLAEGYLTHKKRSEFKLVKGNSKSTIDTLENSIGNLRRANESLTDKLLYMNEENSKLRKLIEGKEE
ncbi:hypothetical protein FDG04_02200 [Clostridium sporogenes]|uniref:hypothetical protein n=1 Tax=Clostridium sporogenes TaxID=1509 RepID=UPI0013D09D4F|nr:hypothetical protein [Clostridium sporogenes]NFQ84144.1 hypothetical protein [Clostridium sporogenes]